MMSLANLEVKFTLEGKTYDVEEFKMEFDQYIDHKGQPQQEVKGGQMMIVLTEVADQTLYTWAKQAVMQKNGLVVFETDLGKKVLEIEFENAYCTNLTRHIHALSGTKTSLIVAPEIVKMNGKPHNNHWGK